MLSMPWHETDALKERIKFIRDVLDRGLRISAGCIKYGISRKTGHKWLSRYKAIGLEGLYDQARARHTHPNKISDEVIEQLLEVKLHHRYWGPRKVRDYLLLKMPSVNWPAASTIGEIFNAHGLVKKRNRRKSTGLRGPLTDSGSANDIWCVDFKGQFKVGNRYMYPLTLTDHYSRFLLGCKGLTSTGSDSAIHCFQYWFDVYGLLKYIRSDNGCPFASASRTGLTRLSAWWIKLGIRLESIRPGQPQENGRHERFHRTLKQETASPSIIVLANNKTGLIDSLLSIITSGLIRLCREMSLQAYTNNQYKNFLNALCLLSILKTLSLGECVAMDK